MMTTQLLFTHALSALHAGTGQGVGVIDLPIAREVATGIPYLPGSSLKGSLRDRCKDEKMRTAIFGPEQVNAHEHAGAVVFSDHRLLFLPVRSLYGIFSWVTCPFVLQRFLRDYRDSFPGAKPDISEPLGLYLKAQASPEEIAISQDSIITGSLGMGSQKMVCLEDLDLKVVVKDEIKSIAQWFANRLFPDDDGWQKSLKQRMAIIPDDVFIYLLDTALEVTARIRLDDDSKTVAKGALWYEEALPGESILYGVVAILPNGKTGKLSGEMEGELKQLSAIPLQLGGKANVGRGVCRLLMGGA